MYGSPQVSARRHHRSGNKSVLGDWLLNSDPGHLAGSVASTEWHSILSTDPTGLSLDAASSGAAWPGYWVGSGMLCCLGCDVLTVPQARVGCNGLHSCQHAPGVLCSCNQALCSIRAGGAGLCRHTLHYVSPAACW